MGLMDTVRNALGLHKPLVPLDPYTPLRVSESARAHLATLASDQGIHLATREVPGGRAVQVSEGALMGPPPPALAPLPITVGDRDLGHLRGLILDRKEDRWCVTAEIDLRARETPNPNGRMYLCQRWLSTGRPLFFMGDGPHPTLATALLQIDGVASVLFRDNTVTVERTGDSVPWDPLDRAVDAALRGYFLQCGHELTTNDLPKREDPLEEEVWAVLEERILPGIHADGGDLQLIGIDEGVVRVAMHGACRGCPASTATLRMGVERTLQEAFPNQIERVEQV